MKLSFRTLGGLAMRGNGEKSLTSCIHEACCNSMSQKISPRTSFEMTTELFLLETNIYHHGKPR